MTDIPRNCWLDIESDLHPSPCVFDEPSDCILNCDCAWELVSKGQCKTDCIHYREISQTTATFALTDQDILKLAKEHGVATELLDGRVVSLWREDHDIREHVLSFARSLLKLSNAAFLRSTVDQVLPEEPELDPAEAWSIEDWNHMNAKKYQREESRRELLAIATEMEEINV